jgi:DMSO/TMAO reductase YedYZ molybdopterin-dependent catalytic subunit
MSDRREFLRATLLALGGATLAGCDRISESEAGPRILGSAEAINRRVQRFLSPSKTLAREYSESDISAVFKPNGTLMPDTPLYQGLMKGGFVDYRLEVGGLVEKPSRLSIDELRACEPRSPATTVSRAGAPSASGRVRR